MEKTRQDQSFDNLANKFEKNIYGSSKGQLRHELLVHHLTDTIDLESKSLDVLDAGGGTGVMTELMLRLGHRVMLTDISADVLTLAKQKLNSYTELTVQQTDILSLNADKQYDLVICHAVLEWLKNPIEVINKLFTLVKPNGYLSLSFFNYDAQLFGNVLYGNFDYVEQGMPLKNIVRLSPNNPQKPKRIISELEALPLNIIKMAGIRCFHDYLKEPEKKLGSFEQLKGLEIKYGSLEPYLWLGKYFLIVSQKSS